MQKFRVFRVGGVKFRLVEEAETRKRDIKNWTVTLENMDSGGVLSFYQSRAIKVSVKNLPLSVRIYNTPREILESMLRAAVSDEQIEATIDVSVAATRRKPLHTETRTLKAIATEAALSSPKSRETFQARIEEGILFLKVLAREFKGREAEEYVTIVFDRLENLFTAMIIDLKEVSYMNSSGISVIARTATTLPTRIVGTSDSIRSVMDLMGLLPLLSLDDSQEQALENLRKNRQ